MSDAAAAPKEIRLSEYAVYPFVFDEVRLRRHRRAQSQSRRVGSFEKDPWINRNHTRVFERPRRRRHRTDDGMTVLVLFSNRIGAVRV